MALAALLFAALAAAAAAAAGAVEKAPKGYVLDYSDLGGQPYTVAFNRRAILLDGESTALSPLPLISS